MGIKIQILLFFNIVILSCSNLDERTEIIFPDVHLNNKMKSSNASLISFARLKLKEVLIFGGEQVYTFTSESNITYEIKLEHLVNYHRSHDQYYDPKYVPTIKQHKILEEMYTADSCRMVVQLEFSIATIKATPNNNFKFTQNELDEVNSQFNTTTFDKYQRNYTISEKIIYPLIKDTIINDVHITTHLISRNRRIVNSYFKEFEIDSTYSFFWNNDYCKSVLSNGDIINVYNSKLVKPELLRQYIYLDSTKEKDNGWCGVSHINDIVSCIYINNE